jgi:hypothetical protein
LISFLKFQNQIFFTVARLVVSGADPKSSSIGTGFILKIDISATHTSYLLITNRHVIPNSFPPIDLVFHTAKNKDEPNLTKFKNFKFSNYSNQIHYHSDPSVDLAALNLSGIVGDSELFWKHLTTNLLSDYTSPEILAGNEVWFVGYPENRFDPLHNLPLLRKGCIASHPKVDFNGKREMIIDAQVFPGSSGSPVFSQLSNGFQLLGIVSETMIKKNVLQSVPVKDVGATQEVLGLGIVIKSTVILEFVDEISAFIKKEISS